MLFLPYTRPARRRKVLFGITSICACYLRAVDWSSCHRAVVVLACVDSRPSRCAVVRRRAVVIPPTSYAAIVPLPCRRGSCVLSCRRAVVPPSCRHRAVVPSCCCCRRAVVELLGLPHMTHEKTDLVGHMCFSYRELWWGLPYDGAVWSSRRPARQRQKGVLVTNMHRCGLRAARRPRRRSLDTVPSSCCRGRSCRHDVMVCHRDVMRMPS